MDNNNINMWNFFFHYDRINLRKYEIIYACFYMNLSSVSSSNSTNKVIIQCVMQQRERQREGDGSKKYNSSEKQTKKCVWNECQNKNGNQINRLIYDTIIAYANKIVQTKRANNINSFNVKIMFSLSILVYCT